MIYNNEEQIFSSLNEWAISGCHTILISGLPGVGKTYMAKEYAKLLHIPDIISLSPVVADLREAINQCIGLTNKIVVIIENLDTGVLSASNILLKFIEEPPANVYIVITCHSTSNVPNTVLSRCFAIDMVCPSPSDIQKYAMHVNASRYAQVVNTPIWHMVHTFTDVDIILGLSQSQIDYLTHLPSLSAFKDTVMSMSWKYGHYADGTTIPVPFILNYIYCTASNDKVKQLCFKAIKDLNSISIAPHAILSKFLMDCKYNLI